MEEHGRTNLIEAVRSVQLLKIDGYCATGCIDSLSFIRSSWSVGGHKWEVHLYPTEQVYGGNCVALRFTLISKPQWPMVMASLSCRLVDPSGNLDPSEEMSLSYTFDICEQQCKDVLLLVRRGEELGYVVNDSLTMQCTLTVLNKLPDMVVIPTNTEVPLQLPSSDLHRHLGELLQDQRGADVTFVLDSGERFPAHKNILSARSPVFKAEFFGPLSETRSQSVQIEDMRAAVFKAMLHFIYTDTSPELDEEPEAATTMAQHLLAAADRYGLGRLKVMCEGKLSGVIDVDTVATTLALAEQRNCSLLKAKCVNFIASRSPETLSAVLATDGYRHLVESCPMVLTELLQAAHGRRN